jgi:hypothetical protein
MTKIVWLDELLSINAAAAKANRNHVDPDHLKGWSRSSRYGLRQCLPQMEGAWLRCQVIHGGDNLLLMDVPFDRFHSLLSLPEDVENEVTS